MKKLKKIVVTGMFAAMIFVFTMFVKIPAASGYVHFGDALLYLFAVLFDAPWAVIAGAVGEGAADVLGGFAIYAPATVIIKSAIALMFSLSVKDRSRLLTVKSAVLTVPAALITIGGYFLADCVINKVYAVVDIAGNAVQAVGSAVIFIVMAAALDKIKITERIHLN